MERIQVVKSILPGREDFDRYVDQLFSSHMLTNNGPLCIELAGRIQKFLNLDQVSLCANGTLGLEIALHAAGAAGKRVITTPFTYVATTSAALWVGCEVLFADIDPLTLSVSAKAIGELMDSSIAAIIPVNVYGQPCDYAGIEKVRGKAVLIYDAAQAFGASYNGRSLLDYGDFAMCSLHATKVFHTFEGGFVVSHKQGSVRDLSRLRAFGHENDNHYSLGINAKMSEAHAAMGLAQLAHFEEHRQARKKIDELYRQLLRCEHFYLPQTPAGFESNYGYFPIILDSEKMLLKLEKRLKARNVFPRRYFYPALTRLPYIKGQSCPVAEDIAPRALCLPIYSQLAPEKAEMIGSIVNTIE